jgi:hypothetical protein
LHFRHSLQVTGDKKNRKCGVVGDAEIRIDGIIRKHPTEQSRTYFAPKFAFASWSADLFGFGPVENPWVFVGREVGRGELFWHFLPKRNLFWHFCKQGGKGR